LILVFFDRSAMNADRKPLFDLLAADHHDRACGAVSWDLSIIIEQQASHQSTHMN
jgi:hypothetical protein